MARLPIGSPRRAAGRAPRPVRAPRSRVLTLDRLEGRTLLTLDFNFAKGVTNGSQVEVGDVATDSAGDIYITGSFVGTADFDPAGPDPGATLTSHGDLDIYVAKYSPTGAFLWAKDAGGTGPDRGIGLAVDHSGSVYVTGFFLGTVSFGTGTNPSNPNGATVFVWKLDTNGTPLWVNYALGAPNIVNQGVGIAVDNAGNVDVTGSFRNTITFNAPGGLILLTAGGLNDAFIAQLNPAGQWAWAEQLKLSGPLTNNPFGQGAGVATDNAGSVYVSGVFRGTISLDPAGGDLHSTPLTNQSTDGFVVKLASNGGFLWGNAYGGPLNDDATGIASDGSGNTYVIGHYTGTVNFAQGNPVPGSTITSPANLLGLFALKLDPGGGFVWVRDLGVVNTSGNDLSRPSVTLDGLNHAYFGGAFVGSARIGNQVLNSAGGLDVLVAEFDTAGNFLNATRAGDTTDDMINGLAATPSGRVAIAGDFRAVGTASSYATTIGSYYIPGAGPLSIYFGQIATVAPHPPSTQGDYNGDRKADLAVFRPTTASWYALLSGGGVLARQFGAAPGDIPVPADYDGDGRADIAVYRPSTSTWFLLQSKAGVRVVQFGAPGDFPVAGDFDGDGKADIAVYRPSNSTFYILRSTAGPTAVQFGAPGLDFPVPADYDGDGRTDIAVYRFSTATWYALLSGGGVLARQFGAPNLDQPVPASYDGSGKANVAVLRPTTMTWYALASSGGAIVKQFGAIGDIPITEDFDGDGKADFGLFRPSNATWYALESAGGVLVQQFGAPNLDVPLTTPPQYRYGGTPGRSATRDAGLLAGAATASSPPPQYVPLPGPAKPKHAGARDQALVAALDAWAAGELR